MSGDTWGDAPSGGGGPVETLGDAPGPKETFGSAPAGGGGSVDTLGDAPPGPKETFGSAPTAADGGVIDPVTSWINTGPTDDTLLKPTAVDLTHLDSATKWLAYCKQRVDILVRNLKDIPGIVGDPVQNGDLPDAAKPPEQAAGAPLPPRTGPPGTLPAPGPTRFGLFPNAITLANTHVATYNNMLAALTQLSHDLAKAVEGTAYIAKQYKTAEDAVNADVARIMVAPPYVPQEQR